MQEIHHFFHSLFSLTLDFRVRLFNILALGGTVISLIMAFLSLGTGSFGNVLINLLLVAVSGGLFLYSYYSGKYQRCYLITIVMIFLIVFPVMFFTSGGYHGGMPAFPTSDLQAVSAARKAHPQVEAFDSLCKLLVCHPERSEGSYSTGLRQEAFCV